MWSSDSTNEIFNAISTGVISDVNQTTFVNPSLSATLGVEMTVAPTSYDCGEYGPSGSVPCTYTYLSSRSPTTEATSENIVQYVTSAFGTTNAPNAPCSLIDMEGNSSQPTQLADTTYPYTVSWAGLESIIVVIDPNQEGGATEDVFGKTFYTSSVEQIGTTGKSPPESFSFATTVGGAVDPDFWCDYGDTWYDQPAVSGGVCGLGEQQSGRALQHVDVELCG